MSEPFHEANERLRERKRIENDKDEEIERLRAALGEVLSDYEAYETCNGKPGRPLHDPDIVARARAELEKDGE